MKTNGKMRQLLYALWKFSKAVLSLGSVLGLLTK